MAHFSAFCVNATILQTQNQNILVKGLKNRWQESNFLRELKLNYLKKVFYFALNFLPLEFLLIKKLDFEKTDKIKVVLVFFDFQLFY